MGQQSGFGFFFVIWRAEGLGAPVWRGAACLCGGLLDGEGFFRSQGGAQELTWSIPYVDGSQPYGNSYASQMG